MDLHGRMLMVGLLAFAQFSTRWVTCASLGWVTSPPKVNGAPSSVSLSSLSQI